MGFCLCGHGTDVVPEPVGTPEAVPMATGTEAPRLDHRFRALLVPRRGGGAFHPQADGVLARISLDILLAGQ